MDIINHLKNDFTDRDITSAKIYRYLSLITNTEKEFLSSLSEEQKNTYKKLKDLEDKMHQEELNEALEYSFKYTITTIKALFK